MDEKEFNGLFDQLTRYKDSITYFASGSDCVDPGISPERIIAMLVDGVEPKAEETDLTKKKNLTLAETMELLSRGLKPYYVNSRENQLVELTIDNEEHPGSKSVRWFHPKIAEKIQERYREINVLEDERDKAIESYDARIAELEERIKKIAENGTDLII